MRLLIVEDEKDLNRRISKRLEKEGYSIDSCFDGEEALSFMAVGEYDAVIMDIMMPKLNGLDVLKTIKRQGNDTPVLLLTAKDSIEDRVSGLDAGAADHYNIPKGNEREE